jgi:hypothetical protein
VTAPATRPASAAAIAARAAPTGPVSSLLAAPAACPPRAAAVTARPSPAGSVASASIAPATRARGSAREVPGPAVGPVLIRWWCCQNTRPPLIITALLHIPGNIQFLAQTSVSERTYHDKHL